MATFAIWVFYNNICYNYSNIQGRKRFKWGNYSKEETIQGRKLYEEIRYVYKLFLISGPLKDFTFFHSGCFRCVECGSKLTLKTYYNNQHSQTDKEVYCSQHVPKIGPGKFDGDSIGIKVALNAPKSSMHVNEQIR